MADRVDRRPRKHSGRALKCIGQSDNGRHVMVRFPGCLVWTMPSKDWLALPLWMETNNAD